ncbi:MAG: hypothetical protein RL173_2247 [Fibrobacterota bacterium]
MRSGVATLPSTRFACSGQDGLPAGRCHACGVTGQFVNCPYDNHGTMPTAALRVGWRDEPVLRKMHGRRPGFARILSETGMPSDSDGLPNASVNPTKPIRDPKLSSQILSPSALGSPHAPSTLPRHRRDIGVRQPFPHGGVVGMGATRNALLSEPCIWTSCLRSIRHGCTFCFSNRFDDFQHGKRNAVENSARRHPHEDVGGYRRHRHSGAIFGNW